MNRHFVDKRFKAKNHRCSIDTHFQNAAATVALSLVPMKAANMLGICNSDQITFLLPDLEDQKSLTLH